MAGFMEKIFLCLKKNFRFFCQKFKTSKKEILFLLLIFGLSFVVRYIGLNFGYPILIHPDEETIVGTVHSMTENKVLNSHNFNRPDQIMILGNWAYLNLISFIKFGKSLAVTFLGNQFFFYHRARILIALLGSLIPVIVYKIGKESRVDFSIPAALLFAFFPAYVRHSHFVTPDIPVTLFTLIIILFSIRYIRTQHVKYLYLATFFVSVNTAEKYPGLLSFVIVVFAIFWVQFQMHKNQPVVMIKNSLLESLKCFCLFLLMVYLLVPHIFSEYGDTISTLKFESRTTHLGADGLGMLGNLKFYLTNFLSFSNIIVVLFFCFGIIGLVKTRNFVILPCFYGVVYWVALSKMALHWERWGLPMYTFPLLLAAFGFAFLWQGLKTKNWARPVAATIFGLVLVWSFLFSISISINLSYIDTSAAAASYSEAQGINRDNSVYDGYTPCSPRFPNVYDPGLIRDSTKYILLSSRMYARYYNEPERYAVQIERYENVMKNYALIKMFEPTPPVSSFRPISWVDDIIYFTQQHLGKELPDRFTGYTILIYQIN